ncbi:MAG: 4-alpha-glucanotransferase [Chloroflexi bacterium]|nr:4-alpha-glucanotransferase [Chloroflexota bacterium]
MTALTRSAGILLHPTSLPGPGGIGSLGAEANAFADMLSAGGLQLWQILPLGPTGYGDSPYAALSALAGNPLLIALEPLRDQGLLSDADLRALPGFSTPSVDYGLVVTGKMGVLRRAFGRVGSLDRVPGIERFRAENRDWLEDFVLYMAIKDEHGGAPWSQWEPALRSREPAALDAARERLRQDIDLHIWLQYVFAEQWGALKRYVNERGIRIIGDIPIFVAYDSADVWANQAVFRLTPTGEPEVVAGVPPDYFSPTGQLWGNPHYRWDTMERDGFAWWVERFRAAMRQVDIVRIDHFRGFAAAWAVPYGHSTAEHGQWEPSPGQALFRALVQHLPELAVIAEDLGVITPDVVALREEFGFPGMQVLQFAFDAGPWGTALPYTYGANTVVYTGTHDNDTVLGWFSSLPDDQRDYVLSYVGTQGTDIAWDMIRLAFASAAVMAVVPLQDVLRLGSGARMNTPGTSYGNWQWRFVPGQIGQEQLRTLWRWAEIFGRAPAP